MIRYVSAPIRLGSVLLVVILGGCGSDDAASDAGGDSVTGEELTAAACSDGKDNDGDGATDCDDDDCKAFIICEADGGPAPDAGPVPEACSPGCGEGEICVDGACEPVGPTKACGSETYGEDVNPLPPNDGIYYVNPDETFDGAPDGTKGKPFKTINDAVKAIPAGKRYTVAVAAGQYDEPVVLGSNIDGVYASAEIQCRCPSMVRITDTVRMTLELPATCPRDPDNTDLCLADYEFRGVIDGCTISPAGFDHDQAEDWRCEADSRGIEVLAGSAVFHVLVRDSVVSGWCSGVYSSAEPEAVSDSSLCVLRSRIGGNVKGVVAQDAAMLRMASPFAGCGDGGDQETLAVFDSWLDHNRDFAIFTHKRAKGVRIRGSLVEQGGRIGAKKLFGEETGYGVYLGDTDSATLEKNVVRDNENRGIALRNEDAKVSVGIAINGNTVDNNGMAGIALQKMRAEVTLQVQSNRVVGTRSVDGEAGGDGIQISTDGAEQYNVDIAGNVVDASGRNGLFYDGAGGNVVNNTVTNSGGFGCLLQQSSAAIGANTWGSNAAGDTHDYTSPVEKYGVVPLPIP